MALEHPLVTEYRQTIPLKLEQINCLIGNLKTSKSIESIQALKAAVHKLAGSAGTYGFMKVSASCKALDIKLQEQIKTFTPSDITQQWLDFLDLFLKQITQDFQVPDIIINF